MRIILYLLLILIFACSDNKEDDSNTSTPFSEEIHVDDDFYFEKDKFICIDLALPTILSI